MTKAAKKDDQDTETKNETPLDPNMPVELTIQDRLNAGKEPSTRWGRIKFDAEGFATVKVPLKDVTIINSLGWLSKEDQEEYIGISQEAQIVATTSDVSEIQARLDATSNANTRLASRNAELEAKLDEMQTKMRKEFETYQAKVDEQMTELQKQLDVEREKLSNAASTEKYEAVVKENEELHKQLKAAQKKIEKLEK